MMLCDQSENSLTSGGNATIPCCISCQKFQDIDPGSILVQSGIPSGTRREEHGDDDDESKLTTDSKIQIPGSGPSEIVLDSNTEGDNTVENRTTARGRRAKVHVHSILFYN